jgi:hypothetical protein
MREVTDVSIAELKQMAETFDGELVKGVVDTAQGRLVLDMDLHVDGEQFLLKSGSEQTSLWGINLHPDVVGSDEFVEFDSMINIRPRQNNRSRGVEDPEIRQLIIDVVTKVIHQ